MHFAHAARIASRASASFHAWSQATQSTFMGVESVPAQQDLCAKRQERWAPDT